MIAGGICSFPTIRNAFDAVIKTIQLGIPVARIEMLNPLQVRACNAYSKLDLPEEPLLLVEFHGSPNAVHDDATRFAEICADYLPRPFSWFSDAEKRKKFWKARHDALWVGYALLRAAMALQLMSVFRFRVWPNVLKTLLPISRRMI